MPKYHAVQSRELVIDAPNAAVARAIADLAFAQKLSPTDLKTGMSVTNIQNIKLKLEKVK